MISLRQLAIVALVFAASCAPVHAPSYVAPSTDTVRAETEPRYGAHGFNIFVQNNSTVLVRVTSLTLHDCTNVRGRCDLMRLNVRVEPGARVRVGTVEPASPDRDLLFRYAFTWTAEQH